MNGPSAAFVIINGNCDILACDPAAVSADPLEWSKRVVQEGLEDGTFWSIWQTNHRGRRMCRLVRLERVTEIDVGELIIVSASNIDVRIPLNDSFSESFRFSLAETQRDTLAAKGVPTAVIDAFILSQVEPLEASILC